MRLPISKGGQFILLFQPHAFAETAVLSLSQGSGMKLDFTTLKSFKLLNLLMKNNYFFFFLFILVFGVRDPAVSYFVEQEEFKHALLKFKLLISFIWFTLVQFRDNCKK